MEVLFRPSGARTFGQNFREIQSSRGRRRAGRFLGEAMRAAADQARRYQWILTYPERRS